MHIIIMTSSSGQGGNAAMELRVLRYFIEVARTQNITAAAEHLHITQPTLSKQLMELEEELGKQLFVRGKRNTTLTEDGIFLYRRAQEIVELADKARTALLSTATPTSAFICTAGTTRMYRKNWNADLSISGCSWAAPI